MNTPLQQPISATALWTITIVCACALVGLIIWFLVQLTLHCGTVKAKAFSLIFAMALGILTEAPASALAFVQYTSQGPSLYTAFGVTIPLFMFLIYPAWTVAVATISLIAMDQRWPERKMWTYYGAIVLLDILIELAMLQIGLARYSGPQGLRIFTLPLAWPFVYTSTWFFVGVVTYYLIPRLPGARILALVPLGGGTMIVGVGIFGWPIVVGLGMGLASPWPDILAVITVVLALGLLKICIGIPRAIGAGGGRSNSLTQQIYRRPP